MNPYSNFFHLRPPPPPQYYPYNYVYYLSTTPVVLLPPYSYSPPIFHLPNPNYSLVTDFFWFDAPTYTPPEYLIPLPTPVSSTAAQPLTHQYPSSNTTRSTDINVPVSGRRRRNKGKTASVDPPVRTTLMIRNIPHFILRGDLMRYLDQHCAKENTKAAAAVADLPSSSAAGDTTVRSEYDFLYLPMDFTTGGNLGYGFVNFTNLAGATRFRESFDNYKWEVEKEISKICKVVDAKIQGKKALVNHFRRARFECYTSDFLPVMFSPPRDGANKSELTIVGHHLSDGRRV